MESGGGGRERERGGAYLPAGEVRSRVLRHVAQWRLSRGSACLRPGPQL